MILCFIPNFWNKDRQQNRIDRETKPKRKDHALHDHPVKLFRLGRPIDDILLTSLIGDVVHSLGDDV